MKPALNVHFIGFTAVDGVGKGSRSFLVVHVFKEVVQSSGVARICCEEGQSWKLGHVYHSELQG